MHCHGFRQPSSLQRLPAPTTEELRGAALKWQQQRLHSREKPPQLPQQQQEVSLLPLPSPQQACQPQELQHEGLWLASPDSPAAAGSGEAARRRVCQQLQRLRHTCLAQACLDGDDWQLLQGLLTGRRHAATTCSTSCSSMSSAGSAAGRGGSSSGSASDSAWASAGSRGGAGAGAAGSSSGRGSGDCRSGGRSGTGGTRPALHGGVQISARQHAAGTAAEQHNTVHGHGSDDCWEWGLDLVEWLPASSTRAAATPLLAHLPSSSGTVAAAAAAGLRAQTAPGGCCAGDACSSSRSGGSQQTARCSTPGRLSPLACLLLEPVPRPAAYRLTPRSSRGGGGSRSATPRWHGLG